VELEFLPIPAKTNKLISLGCAPGKNRRSTWKQQVKVVGDLKTYGYKMTDCCAFQASSFRCPAAGCPLLRKIIIA
jgi:hypothetical protein